MKKIIFVIFIFSSITCNEKIVEIPPYQFPNALLSIQVDSHFKNDLAYLKLDNNPLLNKRITTNYVVNLAWTKNQMLPSGNHTIDFKMPDIGKERKGHIHFTCRIP